MSMRDEGPVYYREIQKNAYLTRISNEVIGGKLKPLGSKKVTNKPMWTQFCVHNGRTPYLEQYPEAESGAALAHRPVWRACLRGARHVTASVKPQRGDQYDFLIDTDNGAVRMLAPDWESMQDWVTTLRNTLHELKIVSRGENVYCSGPAPPPPPPAPRAAARDPTSPLPPTPPTPPDRVPGIELTPNTRTTQQQETTIRPQETTIRPQETVTRQQESTTRPQETTSHQQESTTRQQETITRQQESTTRQQETTSRQQESTSQHQETTTRPQETNSELETVQTIGNENIDISNWEPFTSLPSTSHSKKVEPKKSVAKICGQNICLDDSIFKRTNNDTDSDDEFFADIDKESIIDFENGFKQTLVVSDGKTETDTESSLSNHAANVTVIQVSNKDPPHTAIPVFGPEIAIFDFNFKQNLTINNTENPSFINIVHTEQNDYGTTFESDYGHLSLTTTVSLAGPTNPTVSLTNSTTPTNEELYERLCLASTSNVKPSPKAIKKVKSIDKSRKSSLPNLDINDSTYEYLFLSNNNTNFTNVTSNLVNIANNPDSLVHTGTSNNTNISTNTPRNTSINTSISSEVNSNGDINRVQISSTSVDPVSRVSSVERSRSQNAYDVSTSARERENLIRRVQDNSPKRDFKSDKLDQPPPKPIWKRGLTELSILTRIRSIGQAKRHESPTGNDNEGDMSATSPAKVVHRSRPEARVDSTRRRSSSLSNGVCAGAPPAQLQSLRARQAAELRAEQRRGAALVAEVPTRLPPPIFVDYNKQVWVARWGGGGGGGGGGGRWGGRGGDRVCAVRGVLPKDAAHAAQLMQAVRAPVVDILFHRVPLGNIYVINKREQESIGIKLDGECNIVQVEGETFQPPPGRWALTEVNNRPLNILKGGEEDMHRLSMHGSEVSILIQPSALVKKLRGALKANKTLLGLR